MANRIEGVLNPEGLPPIPVYRHPAPPEPLDELLTVARRWALDHPIPCLAAAFTLGACVAWFVKRK